jgi:stage II sporulation protein D
MKNVLKLSLILAAVMIIMPLLVLALKKEPDKHDSQLNPDKPTTQTLFEDTGTPGVFAESVAENTAVSEPVFRAPAYIRILDAGSGRVVSVPMRDYVIGAVMAEVPADFPEEALKAQAAAISSYAIRQAVKGAEREEAAVISGAETLLDYDISNAAGEFIAYFNETQGRAFYADGYENAYANIAAAVDAVLDYAVVYDSEPIIAAYFSCSSGITESAANVWGAEVPYLVPADSHYDEFAPVYRDSKTFTAEEVKARIETETGIVLGDNPAEWFTITEISPSGTVLRVETNGKNAENSETPADSGVLTGREIREALNLKSAAFEIDYDGAFTFVSRGYGHGVGMSQYGAKALAEEGFTWEEIINHYYMGVEIVKVVFTEKYTEF